MTTFTIKKHGTEQYVTMEYCFLDTDKDFAYTYNPIDAAKFTCREDAVKAVDQLRLSNIYIAEMS